MTGKNEKAHIAKTRRIGIIGGGPAGLFLFKRLVEAAAVDTEVTIFERKNQLGSGMPYSYEGAGNEHITNVSDNELPMIVTSIREWLPNAPQQLLQTFQIVQASFNEYKVVPRLLFGAYLSAQFQLLLDKARKLGLKTEVLLNTEVIDIVDEPERGSVKVLTGSGNALLFDAVVICTGHAWPKSYEGAIPNWFDSPYPPKKLEISANFPIAIKGSSLTAIDAVRTLARSNGQFTETGDGHLVFKLHPENPYFRIVMHSLGGLLPAIRFHLEDTHLSRETVIPMEEIFSIREAHGGFVPLDYLFERNFKKPLSERNPAFYEEVKDLSLEEFVGRMMELRARLNAFTLFEAEYAEAEKSILRRQSVNWKEELAALSFALNYPAKYLSAEDMLRLRKVLMPLISLVIAFVPQGSAREMLALYKAGVLDIIAVDKDSDIKPQPEGGALYSYTSEDGQKVVVPYALYVNATGQPQFNYGDLPFKSLLDRGTVTPAYLRFRSAEAGADHLNQGVDISHDGDGNYYLKLPGVSINDHFQVLDRFGAANERIHLMAVPYMGGLNPDYSGLDFCEAASARIVTSMLNNELNNQP